MTRARSFMPRKTSGQYDEEGALKIRFSTPDTGISIPINRCCARRWAFRAEQKRAERRARPSKGEEEEAGKRALKVDCTTKMGRSS